MFSFLSIVLFLILVPILIKIVPTFYLRYKRKVTNVREKYNCEYALVTGASTGVGFAVCDLLASQGIKVILVSRSEERLEIAKKKLLEKHPNGSFIVQPIDLGQDGSVVSETLEREFGDYNISMVFNNAGYNVPWRLEEVEWSKAQTMLNCNVVAYAAVSHWFLNKWKTQRKGNERAAVVFTSSGASYLPTGLYTELYSSAKSFVSMFAQSFGIRARKFGIDIIDIQTGPVKSEFLKRAGFESLKESMSSAQDPIIVAKMMLNGIGKFYSIDQHWSVCIMQLVSQYLGANALCLLSRFMPQDLHRKKDKQKEN
ncbi:oxidoreductase short chain dehydrogenase/reductase family protein [Anaeramoeba flamelloides]|uniref:Oxidoreductase short chain dehydrogenase/reductase family protein n=1 Tax=Anaeramoeba flamelloides TaxID=1746091 RepID=A0AAV7ZQ18_9EUKA|nr:oxidoreductase short chain dehydrogenase/reductase family protein [Anaeramoeba flamelloides]